ncbi:hypothetical protein OGATHE_000957 [Ogataea polymorpha]|uniref:Uncharacterized protein n=1 Tax=Ogataea polymorpha TaxID=460523 RepID=A0A9P8PSF3_9ASCO|nr:hypothetical protein OGATHE_000957 [Ogataea polymorpha]
MLPSLSTVYSPSVFLGSWISEKYLAASKPRRSLYIPNGVVLTEWKLPNLSLYSQVISSSGFGGSPRVKAKMLKISFSIEVLTPSMSSSFSLVLNLRKTSANSRNLLLTR